MKIDRRIVSRSDVPFRAGIGSPSLPVERGGTLRILDVTEDNPARPAVERLPAVHQSPTVGVENIFAKREPDSAERFGSGGRAFRLVPVSRRFRRIVTDDRRRGLGVEPVELVPA